MLRTSLSMPEKGNIFISKQKHSFSWGAFVCKHEDLSEHFEAVCTQNDGLRWVTFSPENVGQLISYNHISTKPEQIYPEKQQNNSKKDSGSNQMEGDDASGRNAWKNRHCTLNEFVKHSHSLNNFIWQTVQYCHWKCASEEVNVINTVYWWVDEGTMYL